MHQAIEAKEGVEIQNENQTLATITLQNYFRMYDTLSGMTGTAQTEAAELNSIYKLGVVPIPTNMPMIRIDQRDLVYRTEEAKFAAVVDDIAERYAAGQPVLVGTVSVEKSEYLSDQLRRNGVPHEVLNAKQHEREAAIVAQAGRKGAVTVATNMAGRGTDIMLGGNPEFMAVATLKQRGLDPVETPEEYEAAWDEALAKAEEDVKAEHDEVTELGGLYVLGTERHESRRIDNQLRGRSGRQGDPGESRFYLSLQDDLMRLFNAAMVDRFMTTAKMEDDVPIESKMVSRSIQSAQGQVEGRNYEIRKNVLKYDDVLNRQRTVIYDERRRVLEGEDLHEQIRHFINDVVGGYVDAETAEGFADDWDLGRLWTALRTLYPVSVTPEDVVAAEDGSLTPDTLREYITSDAHHAYDAREEQLGEEVMREVERRVVLSVLDRKWREHLYEMDYLQEGIGLRAMAQRDPLVEYQREGFQLFEAMNESIKEESVGFLFNVQVDVDGDQGTAPGGGPAAEQARLQPVSVSDMLAGSGLSSADADDRDGSDGFDRGAPAPDDGVPAAARASSATAEASGEALAASGEAPAAMVDKHPAFRAKGLEQPERRPQQLQYSAPGETGEVEHRAVGSASDTLTEDQLKGVSRNGPCPCGSGKKFKMCHGRA
jgi:preprotein translocase subunit SecA